MRRLYVLLILFMPLYLPAQQTEGMDAVMRFCGTTDPEELDMEEVERLGELVRRPLNLNAAGRSDLEKSGLLSAYQIASLLDYRARHGDILSFTELKALDGFGGDAAEILSPFVSLESQRQINVHGRTADRIMQDLSVRAGVRDKTEKDYMYGMKYRIRAGDVALSLSASRNYSSRTAYPSYLSGCLSWNHGRGVVMAGDFNARFGQGLCLWNTAVIGSLTTPSAFMRKSSGVSPSYSFTGSSAMTGVAGDVNFGKWRASFMLSVPEAKKLVMGQGDMSLLPAVNLSRQGRYGVISMTHVAEFTDFIRRPEDFRIPQMKSSLDAAVCVRGVNLFGETAFDWVRRTTAAKVGTDFSAGDDLRLAALLAYCPSEGFSNEYRCVASGEYSVGKWVKINGKEGFGASARRFVGNFSVDAAYHPKSKSKDNSKSVQFKCQTDCECMAAEFLKLKVRVSERFRTWGERWRTDIRLDAAYLSEKISASLRLNVLQCISTGMLGYAECGYSGRMLSANLRLGVFRIDNWDDRIYVYEHDAPDSFNVPAYYGRGYWTALYLSWKPYSWIRLYMRASYQPGKAELKLQCVLRL